MCYIVCEKEVLIMGIQKRTHLKSIQKEKRKKRRAKLAKAGKNPNDYFIDGIYVNKNSK
jgi:hypothetical protein